MTITINIEYFSDVLFIWAYAGQIRIDKLRREFPDSVKIQYRFLPIFAAARQHFDSQWHDRGGLEGFSRHLSGIADNWEHIDTHPSIWKSIVPESSRSAHLYLKAIQILHRQGNLHDSRYDDYYYRNTLEQAVWRFREAFFKDGRNIALRSVQDDIATELHLPVRAIHAVMNSGQAHAELYLDDEAKLRYQIPGSPTIVLNGGRQTLYGNVGYRIIEANVRELLHNEYHGEASWC